MSSSSPSSSPWKSGGRQGRGSAGRGRSYSNRSGRGGTSSSSSSSSPPWKSNHGGGRSPPTGGRDITTRKASSRSDWRSPEKIQGTQVFFSSNHFDAFVQKCGGVKGFKVHKPKCACPKVKKILSTKMEPALNTLLNASSERSVSATEEGTGDTTQAEKATEEEIGSSATTINTLDGLLVLPDCKIPTAVYLCEDTTDNLFQADARGSEEKLRKEMFGGSENKSSRKASCAMCLLEEEPNGFVCVTSKSKSIVDFCRDTALASRDEQLSEANDCEQGASLHHDHAHHICTLPRRVLLSLLNARTRDATRKANNQLIQHFVDQGPQEISERFEVELGHHLVSMLEITRSDKDANTAFWMVLLYVDQGKLSLDLPGGKRHLGESAFEGAIRETWEESSLKIDETWLVQKEPRKSIRATEHTNVYYMLHPPTELLMSNMEQNQFWKSKREEK